MATLREIKRRIGSVKSTQQITKAMKMVAAAKLRKAQNSLVAARPYAHELSSILQRLSASPRAKSHYFRHDQVVNRCFVLVTADKGLCGSFNANIIRRAIEEIRASDAKQDHLVIVGKKGYDYFRRLNFPVRKHYIDFLNHLDFDDAIRISRDLSSWFVAKKFDSIKVIYQEFKSPIQQEIVVEQFLPIEPATDQPWELSSYIFDPRPDIILDKIIPLHLHYSMWRILLESSASEHGARMTAMEAATDNASEMIKSLVLYYNQARQAAITKELNEIVGGAEALNK